jgi:hypothetical protein
LCHGSNGNYNADVYFSCKNCYAANHMHNLPRKAPKVKREWVKKTPGTSTMKVPVAPKETAAKA